MGKPKKRKFRGKYGACHKNNGFRIKQRRRLRMFKLHPHLKQRKH